jgi:predicted nucleic acid-binding protein
MAGQYVIDANATLGLFLRLPYSQKVEKWMRERQAEEAKLVVPTLWEYECLSGLRRAEALGQISSEQTEWLFEKLFALELHRVEPTLELHRASLHWAEKIGQAKVYGAQYLALAESLSAEFWTADKRLFHAAQELGANWVHEI